MLASEEYEEGLHQDPFFTPVVRRSAHGAQALGAVSRQLEPACPAGGWTEQCANRHTERQPWEQLDAAQVEQTLNTKTEAIVTYSAKVFFYLLETIISFSVKTTYHVQFVD
ncbi:hypothetical protein Y1Q_0019652 [Alligator mississippiensis]|uniref:Uncharacterized protein n=1 Tax=Alligator mississippiensis TaxID=8496 RepID=A0A151PER1_ALLMI|nr:hypothetical protein Y1Q_0019652 [Alligator mississippiensis]